MSTTDKPQVITDGGNSMWIKVPDHVRDAIEREAAGLGMTAEEFVNRVILGRFLDNPDAVHP